MSVADPASASIDLLFGVLEGPVEKTGYLARCGKQHVQPSRLLATSPARLCDVDVGTHPFLCYPYGPIVARHEHTRRFSSRSLASVQTARKDAAQTEGLPAFKVMDNSVSESNDVVESNNVESNEVESNAVSSKAAQQQETT